MSFRKDTEQIQRSFRMNWQGIFLASEKIRKGVQKRIIDDFERVLWRIRKGYTKDSEAFPKGSPKTQKMRAYERHSLECVKPVRRPSEDLLKFLRMSPFVVS